MPDATAETASRETLLRVAGVRRVHGRPPAQTVALDGIDLEVTRGEVVAMVGPSGSGKSTLLRILGAMDAPTEGRVEVAGQDLGHLSDRQAARFRGRTIGFVFQFFNLIPTLTALDNVALPAQLAGASCRDARHRAHELLTSVGLGERAQSYPDALSGGQQQRVAIARALVQNPPLILADEPTGALDRSRGEHVLGLLVEKVRQQGATLLMATHSRDAERMATRVLEIEDGRIAADRRTSRTSAG